MENNWTFSRKLLMSFAVLAALTIIMAFVTQYAMSRVVNQKDRVIDVNAKALAGTRILQAATARTSAASRGYIITSDPGFLHKVQENDGLFTETLRNLRQTLIDPEALQRLNDIEAMGKDYGYQVSRLLALQQNPAQRVGVPAFMVDQVLPRRLRLDSLVDSFADYEEAQMSAKRDEATKAAASAMNMLFIISAIVIVLACMLAWFLSRFLSTQIASAVQNVQSASAELQATATQQATGAREQASALTEITTTISELLATSRQIAESAQHVAAISTDAAKAATGGDRSIQKAGDSVGGIKRQVDSIANHMLDLGRKSQQIGTVVDIIGELSEQTNILAINANIEAAGAGDSGRRFAVVADEIRKLADRVGSSTKDIRVMIDEMRAAVNATVMATETGTKAVDSGTRDFGQVNESLRQIAGLVTTNTEAAREIELSTKQQSTAVEQVNQAVANVAQVAREAEASMRQALETASQLNMLAINLTGLIRSRAN
jgi:methyl-accepting chemotaxis protein